jgi:hypothetical protein
LEACRGKAHFIRLVVVLRVVFENLGLLLVIEVADEIVEVEVLAPFLAVDEPIFVLVYACIMDMRTYIFSESATSNLRARRNRNCKELSAP